MPPAPPPFVPPCRLSSLLIKEAPGGQRPAGSHFLEATSGQYTTAMVVELLPHACTPGTLLALDFKQAGKYLGD